MLELRADVELKDTIVMAMPKLVQQRFYTCTVRTDVVKNPKKPSQAPGGVLTNYDGKVTLVDNKGGGGIVVSEEGVLVETETGTLTREVRMMMIIGKLSFGAKEARMMMMMMIIGKLSFGVKLFSSVANVHRTITRRGVGEFTLRSLDVLQGFSFILQMGFTLILATLDGLDVGLLGDVIGEDNCDDDG
nr:hypothetical protein [Tanacetum cinerariifolium]